MTDNNDYNEFKSSWNMADGLTEQINNLLVAANDCYIRGKLHEAWKRLKAVQQRIVQLIPEEEEQKLIRLSNDVCALTLSDKDPKRRELASKVYDKLNGKIMRILQEKDLLHQGKKDSTTMKF